MMRFWVFLWCVLWGSEHLCAQNYAIEGRVVDAAKGTRLVKCRVELMSLSDTTYFQDETNLYGNFYIGRIPAPGMYLLVVSQVGYARYAKAIELREPYQKLDPIRMVDSLYVLNETKVKAKRDALIQKGDTLEIQTKQYKTNPDMDAVYFLSKIPGINMDGNITVQGDSVSKVQINGMLVFGENPKLLLQNLPASVIEKIQVYDDIPDGTIKDSVKKKNQPKVLNVVTNKNYFSRPRVKLAAGVASPDLYFADINVFSQRKEEQVTLNVNRNRGRLKTNDYFEPAAQFSSYGLPVTNDVSLSVTKQFYKKTTLNLEAGWWSDANTVQNRSIQRYADSEESQGLVSHQNTNSNNNQTPSLRLKLEHKPDSLKQITFRGSVRSSDSRRSNVQHAENTLLLIDQIRDTRIRSNTSNIAGSVQLQYYQQNRAKKSSINMQVRMGTDKGFARSRTYTEVFSADTLLQHYQNLSNTRQYFIEPELSYRYNLTSKHSLELNLSGSQRQTQNEQEVLNFSAGEADFTLPDSSLYVHTLQTISDYKAALQYTRTAEVLQINATLGLIRYAMHSTTADFTAYGRQFLLPDFSVYLDYTLIKHHELGLSLVRRNEIPSLWDLTPILNNSNRLWMNIGNPALNVGSAYRLGLRYKWKNPRSGSFLVFSTSANLVRNPIRQNVLLATSDTLYYGDIPIEPGAQLRYPANTRAYSSYNANFSYDFPIKPLRVIVKSRMGFNYFTRYSYTNYRELKSLSRSIDPGLTVNSTLSAHIDFTVYSRLRLEWIQQEIPFTAREFMLNAFLNIEVMKNTYLKLESVNNRLSGQGKSQRSGFSIFDISVSRSFFPKTPTTLTFLAHDIFNSYKNYDFRNYVNYTSEEYNNGIRRYFLLKLSVRL